WRIAPEVYQTEAARDRDGDIRQIHFPQWNARVVILGQILVRDADADWVVAVGHPVRNLLIVSREHHVLVLVQLRAVVLAFGAVHSAGCRDAGAVHTRVVRADLALPARVQ